MHRYPKSRRTAKQRAERARAQEATLDSILSEPSQPSLPNLRGIGIVTPPPVVRYSKPRYVRGNTRYKSGRSWITTNEAPYLELDADVRRSRKAKVVKQATPQPNEPKHDLRSLALGDSAARFAD